VIPDPKNNTWEPLAHLSGSEQTHVHTGPYHSRFHTCGPLTHTLSTYGLRRLSQRFPTSIIRDSPAPFLLSLTPSPVFVFHHSYPFLHESPFLGIGLFFFPNHVFDVSNCLVRIGSVSPSLRLDHTMEVKGVLSKSETR
jgi:hypothetical protein